MKFLIDMNISPQWCDFFTSNGYDAVHWSATGDPSASDEEIFSYARENDYIIVTHDLDFSVLLAFSNKNGPSVIQLRTSDTFPDLLFPKVLKLISDYSESLRDGALVSVDIKRSRVRILPIIRE